MANFGPNRQLRAYHSLFTTKRDHKVAALFVERVPRSTVSTAVWQWTCETCGEDVDRHGNGFRHQPVRVVNA